MMMRWISKRIGAAASVVCAALLTVTLSGSVPAKASGNMVPDYEVKLLMQPDAVLNSDYKLKSGVRDTFGMPDTVTKMNVQFLDTDYYKDLYSNGWIARIRKMEGEDNFELTYKKRYPIDGNDIDGALTTACLDGFDSSESNYAAQVEWGYQNKTLSISRTKSGSKSGYSGMELPSLSDSRSLLINNAPGKFDNWFYSGWGTDMLSFSRIYGPILAKRYVGTWSGLKTYIEIWPIMDASGYGTEYIVEISFKTTDQGVASQKHDELIVFLQSKGWFLAQDSLKTQLIMDRY